VERDAAQEVDRLRLIGLGSKDLAAERLGPREAPGFELGARLGQAGSQRLGRPLGDGSHS
jgi:hypothetical protein